MALDGQAFRLGSLRLVIAVEVPVIPVVSIVTVVTVVSVVLLLVVVSLLWGRYFKMTSALAEREGDAKKKLCCVDSKLNINIKLDG